MRIGIDFDNTIVCYDSLFHKAALKAGLLPQSVEETKLSVRDYLKKTSRHGAWEKLQAEVYGQNIMDAKPFMGAKAYIAAASKIHEIFIVSHKTEFPNSGKNVNLRKQARKWLKYNGFTTILSESSVFFEATRKEKIDRIRKLKCSVFIDDLLEIFDFKGFPSGVRKILFDPNLENPHRKNVSVLKSWEAAFQVVEMKK